MTKVKIPDGWKLEKIGNITDATAGGTPSTSVLEYWNGDIKWMNSGEVNHKKVSDVEGRITNEGFKNSSTKIIPKYCILIGLAGQGKTRGTVAINLVELCTNQSIATILPCSEFDSWFLYYNLDSRYSELRKLSTGEGGRGGLNLGIIKNLDVLLPPLDEQKKIAEILGTCDRALEITEKLLTAKRKLKQALMQKLLTGKVRFPEFVKSNKCQKYHFLSCPTDWKIYSIGEICREISNKNASPETTVLSCTKYDGLVPSLEYFGRKVYGDNLDKYKIVKRNQFAYATNHIEEGSIGLLKDLDIGLVSPIYTIFETKKSFVLPEYLILILKTEVYRKIFESLTLASVDRRDSLRWNGFSKIKVAIPNIDEQIKITKLFNKLTLEINCLEKKLFYLQEQKKGLMQQLLTGKIRVKQ